MRLEVLRIVLLATTLAAITGCQKDFLEKPPTSNPAVQTYVTDINSSYEYLNGIYVDLSQSFAKAENTIYADLVADNVKPISGGSMLIPHYSYAQVASEADNTVIGGGNMNNLWYGCYKIARNCSFLIENVNQYRAENPDMADEIIGQAYAIRALVYHQLVNVFAQPYAYTADASHPGIPYITVSDYKQPVNGRNTVAEVYAMLAEDLGNAIALLPEHPQTPAVHMDATAAKALLARVYLFKGNYAAAKNLSASLARNNVLLTGADYPSQLFADASSSEALFYLPPESESYSTNFSSYYYRSYIQFLATADIAGILTEDTADSRAAWVNLSGEDWNITKFPVAAVPGITNPATAYYHPVIRSAEMFLTAAEAYVQLGNEDSARYFLDAVRMRANPNVPPVTAGGEALLEMVRKERRKELAFEGFRMFDLLRTRKGVERKDVLAPAPTGLPFPNDRAIAPIDQSDVNYYGLPQNKSY